MTITTLAATSPILEEVLPHTIFHIGPFAVTNTHILMTLGAILVFITFFWLAKRMQPAGPHAKDHVTRGRFAQLLEVMVIFCREDIARDQLGELTDKYLFYVWTTFFFVLFCNVIGLFPIGTVLHLLTLGWLPTHTSETLAKLKLAPTGNVNMTAALALVSFFMMNFVGLRHRGLGYFKSFAPLPFTKSPMVVIACMMAVIEVFSMFIKTLALCIRLFANMIVGHMVIAAMIAIVFLVAGFSAFLGYTVAAVPATLISLIVYVVDVFVALLQAYIFAYLTVVFIALGLGHGGEEHEPEPIHHEAAPALAASEENLAAMSV